MKRRSSTFAIAAAALTLVATSCSLEPSADDGDAVTLVIGYQSKTINTVTAGTLLRAQGYLEQRLQDVTEQTGTKYSVEWQDYDTGAPITAQMVAEKIDIGSMGDYPMLINGSRTQANPRSKTEIVSVTGYNPEGALNMVVVPPNSPATTLGDLAGKKVSASVGSAGHGTLVQALDRAGIDGYRRRSAQPAAAGRILGPGIRSGGGAVPVRGLARTSRLPGQGQAAVRRRRTPNPDPARCGGP